MGAKFVEQAVRARPSRVRSTSSVVQSSTSAVHSDSVAEASSACEAWALACALLTLAPSLPHRSGSQPALRLAWAVLPVDARALPPLRVRPDAEPAARTDAA